MERSQGNFFYRNIANAVSILGVLPMALLFMEDGYLFLIPFILYNNFMDDLDGVLAGKLKIRSQLGANLDNVCDTVVHVTLVLLISARFGGFALVTGVIAAAAVILRLTSRLDPAASKDIGSPTNELIRHILFVLLLTNQFHLDPAIYLVILFILHSASMLVRFKLPFMIRGMAKSATSVALVNVALIVSWQVPILTPYIATAFFATYLYSFAAGGGQWLRHERSPTG